MYYIYRITNLINGKTYIGQHKYKDLNDSYMGSGIALRASYEKYGIENFKKDILVFGIVKKDLINLLEKEYIKFYRSIGKAEYNIADGGQGFSGKHGPISEEAKRKISEAKKGQVSWMKGKHHSEDAKRKNSEAHKGHQTSEETRRKLSEAKKDEKNPMKGKHHSEDTRRKMSDTKKGKHWKLVDGKRVWY